MTSIAPRAPPAGRTCFVVGTGPSIAMTRWELLGHPPHPLFCLIAVNNAYLLPLPWDFVYGSDLLFWRHHAERARQLCPKARLISPDPTAHADHGTEQVYGKQGRAWPGVGDPFFFLGSNSGYAAANFAISRGARRVILLGMDCRRDEQLGTHFFGEHPPRMPVPQHFDWWLEDWKLLGEEAARQAFSLWEAMPTPLELPGITKVDFHSTLELT